MIALAHVRSSKCLPVKNQYNYTYYIIRFCHLPLLPLHSSLAHQSPLIFFPNFATLSGLLIGTSKKLKRMHNIICMRSHKINELIYIRDFVISQTVKKKLQYLYFTSTK